MKQKAKQITSALLALCIVVSMLFAYVPHAQAASYEKTVTKTFTIPADTQYQIWFNVKGKKGSKVKATVTSNAKKSADRRALLSVSWEYDTPEQYIDENHKSVSMNLTTQAKDEKICLYLTNGSSKKIKYTVKFSGKSGAKVKYSKYENAGEGAG